MSGQIVTDAAGTILDALIPESTAAFQGIVSNLNTHVLPSMAMIARSLATIAAQREDGTISKRMADIEIRMAVRAAASIIVGFANETLIAVERIINTILNAVKQVVNGAVGIALL